jgi:hypothetical protein
VTGLLALILATPVAGFDEAYLPLDHWAYPLLERLRARGAPIDVHLADRPLSRGQGLAAVQATVHDLRLGRISLDETSLGHLRLLQAEFAPEMDVAAGPRHHRASWTDVDLEWAWRVEAHGIAAPVLEPAPGDSVGAPPTRPYDPGPGRGTVSPPHEETAFVRLVPEGTLRVGDRFLVQERLHYRLRFGDTVPGTSLDVSSGEGEFVFEDDDFVGVQRTLDTTVRVILGGSEAPASPHLFALDLARMPVRLGPGRDGTLLLSGRTPPMDQIRFRARAGWFQLTHTAAELRTELGEKWIAIHRIAYERPGFTLGISESVVFGNRSFDFAYLSPAQIFYLVESNIGAEDNNLFGVDLRWRPRDGVEVYGEVVGDDSNLRNGLDYFGNKTAVQLGVVLAGTLPAVDLAVEWSAVDEFTYTHVDPINVYAHYEQSIGHPIGNDADLLSVTLSRWLAPRVQLDLRYEQERQGAGWLYRDHRDRGGDGHNWLSGTVERRRAGVIRGRVVSVRGIEVRGEVRREWFRRFANVADARQVAATRAELWLKGQW